MADLPDGVIWRILESWSAGEYLWGNLDPISHLVDRLLGPLSTGTSLGFPPKEVRLAAALHYVRCDLLARPYEFTAERWAILTAAMTCCYLELAESVPDASPGGATTLRPRWAVDLTLREIQRGCLTRSDYQRRENGRGADGDPAVHLGLTGPGSALGSQYGQPTEILQDGTLKAIWVVGADGLRSAEGSHPEGKRGTTDP